MSLDQSSPGMDGSSFSGFAVDKKTELNFPISEPNTLLWVLKRIS